MTQKCTIDYHQVTELLGSFVLHLQNEIKSHSALGNCDTHKNPRQGMLLLILYKYGT